MFTRFIKIEGWLITYIKDYKEGYSVSWDTNGFSKLDVPSGAVDIRIRPIGKARKLR